jgi:hypothetical protein
MYKKLLLSVILVCGSVLLASCQTVYNAHRADMNQRNLEGTIVFVRPIDHTLLGTKSIRDYVEITYERAERNEAGLLQVEIGFRNRGGQYFYDTHGPNFPISVKTDFYNHPLPNTGAPVYATNWQTVVMLRGATAHYKVICPSRTATGYQVTVSEFLK